ncbi:hypothetical protein KR009_004212, partial [Drosophila setifemur]
ITNKIDKKFISKTYLTFKANSLVEFTNIKCESLNKEYMGFEYCHLKSVNRTYKYLSLKANLYNVPINNFRVTCLVEFTNIKCITFDKKYMDFEWCLLKSVNRSYKYFSVKANLFKVPITQVTVNFALYKRLSGYKPFLYNITLDACRFYHNPRSNPVASYFYDFFKNVSNMNHSCPYDHDVVIDKITVQEVNERFTKLLPFPEGNYMLKTIWLNYKIERLVFKIYFSLT